VAEIVRVEDFKIEAENYKNLLFSIYSTRYCDIASPKIGFPILIIITTYESRRNILSIIGYKPIV